MDFIKLAQCMCMCARSKLLPEDVYMLISEYLSDNYEFIKFSGIKAPCVFRSASEYLPTELLWHRLSKIHMNNFDGSLEPLRGAPLRVLYMNKYSTKSKDENDQNALIYAKKEKKSIEKKTWEHMFTNDNAIHEQINLSKERLKNLYAKLTTGNLNALRGAPLKRLSMNKYDGPLHGLVGAPLIEICMNSFGTIKDNFGCSLKPLWGAPLRKVCMNKFSGFHSGDLEPLRGAPLEYLSMKEFRGNIKPLMESPLRKLIVGNYDVNINNMLHLEVLYIYYMYSNSLQLPLGSYLREFYSYVEDVDLKVFRETSIVKLHLYGFRNGDLSPLKYSNITQLVLPVYLGNLESLRGTPIKIIIMNLFNESLEPLRETPIEVLEMNSFTGDLEPLRRTQIKKLTMNIFRGSLKPLQRTPIEYIRMDLFAGKSLEPLRNTSLKELYMDNFYGDLEPISKIKLKKLSMRLLNIFNVDDLQNI